MSIRSVFSEKAPQPVGPYSQAVQACSFLFISGQIPLDPLNGEVVGHTTAQQTRTAITNLKAVLHAAGLGTSNLVKTTVYLRRMDDFSSFNQVYQAELEGAAPARSIMEVSGLPKDVLVEIEAVACR